jgi:hypothetical protein
MLLTATLVAAITGAATAAQAATITWNPEFEFSGSGGVLANGPTSLTLTLTDIVGGVHFSLTGNLADGEFLRELYLNFDPSKDPTTLVFGDQAGVAPANIATGVNAFQADGDGLFDILLTWPTGAGPGRFEGTDSFTATIAGVMVADFEFNSEPAGGHGPFLVAFRVQGLGADNEGSGWFTDTNGGQNGGTIPEPGMMLLLGIGLMGVAARIRQKR